MPGMAATRRKILARFAAMLAISAAGGNVSFSEDGLPVDGRVPTEVRRLSDPVVDPLPELQLANVASTPAPLPVAFST